MGPLPIDSSNIFSLLTFWFAVPLLKISTKRPLTEQDLWDISEKESAEVNVAKLRAAWEKELKTKNPSFLYALFKANLSIVMWSVVLISIWCGILIFIPVYLVRNLVLFVQAAEYSPSGWGYAAGFFGASLIQSILLNQLFWMTYRIGSRMRSGAAMLVYEKALRVKSSGNIGEVANLVSSDCQRLLNFGWHFNFVWILPVVVGVVGGLLIWKVGWVGVIGMVFMFLMAIWQLYTGRLISNYKNKATQYTDTRVQLMSEILIAIKLVKFYAWEVPFAKSVTEARAVEVRQIRNLAFLRATNFILMFVTSPFTVLLVFSAYIALGNTLEAETAFVALALINSVSFPMTMLPIGVAGVAEGRVASKRIQKFLKKGELQPRQAIIPLSELRPGSPVIDIVDGEYSWENVEIPTLRNINLQVPQGRLIAVVGPVGSGKSTLISAIMEQVTRIKGTFKVFGTMSYVPQQAWIQNMTVRENILFGKPYDEKKYRDTIQACALEPDLKQFIAGDQTEIGERGINLSGGQKQRVSIARAVYAGADIILLDDPLSAVDQHVGKHLFDNCIRNTLREKTIILVTHQLQYLPQCDSVVLMSGGTISAQGSFNELMLKVDFSTLIGQHVDLAVEDECTESTPELGWRNASKAKPKSLLRRNILISEHVAEHNKPKEDIDEYDDESQEINGKLTKAEERKQGSVASETYKQYIISGGAFVAILVLLLHILSQGAYVASFWWLTYLTAHPEDDVRNIGIYAILVSSVLILCTARELLYQSFTLRASTNIHNLMFRTILRAPMAFFDRTPLGRIINRFAADMDIIDYLFPDISMNAIHTAFLVLGVLVLVSVILHWMPLLMIPMAAMFLVAQHFYRKANRDIKRIDSASKSPLFQHVSATLQGLSVLRAFRQESAFAHQNLSKVDHAVRTSLHMYMIQRWLGFCLDCIVTLLVFSTAALCVGLKDTINASQAGLVVTYVMQLADNFQWTIRTIADSEAQMTSVERILDYCNPHLDSNNYKKLEKQRSERMAYEAPPIIPDNRPAVDWPSQGIVKFDNVTIEYTPGTPILRNLSFETRSMEKIGIVGRTGAGKSTVTLALFRIMECASGQITIDNQNISLIGTHDLRSKIGIIPQDPVLFEGTIRTNLDPFGMYEDKDIWETLKQVHLDSVVSAFPEKLEAIVEINGENWSIGQRQLICIGRALLKHCKVLVLDEATAAVDLETDSLIQETIRENFSDCTIITIAHRLNTIIDSDRVLVLDKGQMVEFESPHVLLRRENGFFRRMVEKMGPAAYSRMATMSQNSFFKSQQQIRNV